VKLEFGPGIKTTFRMCHCAVCQSQWK